MKSTTGTNTADICSAIWIIAAGLLFVAGPVAAGLGLESAVPAIVGTQAVGRLVYTGGLVVLIALAAVRLVRRGG